jgi:hypothetical protein
VIVPLASVVVVVVVVVRGGGRCGKSCVFISGCRIVCPHANDATIAKAMLKSAFFMLPPFY